MQTVEFLFICISKELAIKTLKIARVVLIGRKGFGADVVLQDSYCFKPQLEYGQRKGKV